MEGKSINLVAKYVFFFLAMSTVIAAIFVYSFYRTFSRDAIRAIREEALTDAQAIAESVDFTGHDEIHDPSDRFLPQYQRIFEALYAAEQTNPRLSYVYTMRPKLMKSGHS